MADTEFARNFSKVCSALLSGVLKAYGHNLSSRSMGLFRTSSSPCKASYTYYYSYIPTMSSNGKGKDAMFPYVCLNLIYGRRANTRRCVISRNGQHADFLLHLVVIKLPALEEPSWMFRSREAILVQYKL